MRRLAAAFGLFFLACAPAPAAEPVIESLTLENGMEVIVIENHRVPAVSHMLWFRTGAADDPPLKSGLAHYHEHLMFQGTARYKKGEYADIIARHGGVQNAFTGHDATAYYANLAKEHLPVVMALEADRLRGLKPAEADALNERQVIIEERRQRIDNDPQALFAEQMNAALFLHHPYRTPVIGWKHEMEGLTPADALEFHRRHYHPGNAVLVVSGDITLGELKPLAEKYYGGIAAGPETARNWKAEPPHLAARRITLTHPNVRQPLWRRSYLAPSVREGEAAQVMPLFVLAQLLGGGRTGRLYEALVVKAKLAAAVSASYDGLSLGPSAFSVTAVPAGDADPAKLERMIDAELEKLAEKGVTAQELARAQSLLKAEAVYAREGLQSMAYLVGWIRAVGLPVSYYGKWAEKIDAVTAEQVQAAARAVFQPARSVTGTLLPEKGAPHAQ